MYDCENGGGDSYWEITHEKVTHCSKVPHHAKIWILPVVRKKIDLLLKKYVNLEWLAYAVIDKDGLIVDIIIPKQIATSGSVSNVEPDFELHEGYRIGGVIHSHNNMGAFFSSVDRDFLNENHDFSMVVSTKGYKAVCRYKTPCGAYKQVSAKVKIKHNFELNEENFIKEAEGKINNKIMESYKSNMVYGRCLGSEIDQQWNQDSWKKGYQKALYDGYDGEKTIKRSSEMDCWNVDPVDDETENENDIQHDDIDNNDPKEMYFDERDRKEIEEEIMQNIEENEENAQNKSFTTL